MDSEDEGRGGGGDAAWLKNGEWREGEMWARERNERERARKRRGWKFSPASINHFGERILCVCVCVC